MFENLNTQNTQKFREGCKDLCNIIFQDEKFAQFASAYENPYEAIRDIANYFDGQYAASRLNKLSAALYDFNSMGIMMDTGLTYRNAITLINTVNGYDVKFGMIGGNIPEVTEKTEDSLAESIYTYLDLTHYAGVKDDPRPLMAIHLARLADMLTDKIAVLYRETELDAAEDMLKAPEEKGDYKSFFENLDPEQLGCLTDDKQYAAKDAEYTDQIEALSKKIEYGTAHQDEVYEEILKGEAGSAIREELAAIDKEFAARRDEFKSAELEKEKKRLLQENQENIEYNQSVAAENERREAVNRAIDENIKKINDTRRESLERCAEAAKRRSAYVNEREKQYSAEVAEYHDKKIRLGNLKRELEEKNAIIDRLLKSEKYIVEYYPGTEDLRKIDSLREKSDAISDVRLLMRRLGEGRKPEEVEAMLSSSRRKDINNVYVKLDKIDADYEKIADKLRESEAKPGDQKNAESYRKTLASLEKQKEGLNDILDTYRPAIKLQYAFDKLMEDKDIKSEYSALAKKNPKMSIYDLICKVEDSWAKKLSDMAAPHQKYFWAYNTLTDIKVNKDLPPREEFDKVKADLEETVKALADLKEPNKAEFDAETKAEALKIYSKKEVVKINKDADAAIEEQNKGREELEKTFKVLTGEEIELKLEEKRKDLDSYVDTNYAAEAQRAKDRLLAAKKQLAVASYIGGMRTQVISLTAKQKNLVQLKDTASDLYKTAKDKFDKQQKTLDEWKKIKESRKRHADTLDAAVSSLSAGMMKGKKEGHSDSPEFLRMKTAVDDANAYITENKEKLAGLDEETMNGLKTKLDEMKAASENYVRLKQKGIHWISSEMRFVRLGMADSIKGFTDHAVDIMEKMKDLGVKETELEAKAAEFSVPDPGKNYKEYVTANAPKEVVSSLVNQNSQQKSKATGAAEMDGLLNFK